MHKIILATSLAIGLATAGEVHAQTTPQVPYTARAFSPAHADLARSAGIPARLANEAYVEALARVVYYWAYPAVDIFGRTSMWETMKEGPGMLLGTAPGGTREYQQLHRRLPAAAQRIVVTPNNDTFYGATFVDLGREPVVVQTPTEVPARHYWTIQIADVFTNVVYQLGSASKTPAGKFLLVGPDWTGEKPNGFIDILRLPTNYGGAFQRSFASRTPEGKARAIAVLDQMGGYPLSQNQVGQRKFDCEASGKNVVYPAGVTAQMIAADPDIARPQWVVPERFWDELEKMLAVNAKVGENDATMADQARTLIALRKSAPAWQALLDKAALEADAALHTSAKYEQVGVGPATAGNARRTVACGAPTSGRAQAAIVYILVNDYHEAVYLIRGTDAKGALLNGKHRYTMTFPKDALPPVDRSRGGFWSLTIYDKDYFMLPKLENGRTNVGTVSLDANELKFAPDGSLTITMSHEQPTDPSPAPIGCRPPTASSR